MLKLSLSYEEQKRVKTDGKQCESVVLPTGPHGDVAKRVVSEGIRLYKLGCDEQGDLTVRG